MDGKVLTLVIIGALVLLFVGPVLTIMALNCLFSLSIPIKFSTWFATFWLHIVFGGLARISKSN